MALITLSTFASLVWYLTFRLLKSFSLTHVRVPVRVGKISHSAKESFDSIANEPSKEKIDRSPLAKQARAMRDYFQSTGGYIKDLRIVRSAMFLSDEINRAMRGTDIPNQQYGWRQYNRFYAEGTEDLFTNVPTGRSPLLMKAPSDSTDLERSPVDKDAPRVIEYKAIRDSNIKQVGRAMDEIEQDQLVRLSEHVPETELGMLSKRQRDYLMRQRQQEAEDRIASGRRGLDQYGDRSTTIQPRNDVEYEPRTSSDLRVGAYQPYEEKGQGKPDSVKRELLKFEGEISERRPDLDYKFEDFD
eukprot:gb/GECH01002063.1/.p1 GENE.gb/GECH01002063.1/~~gb/GECH01002063.1/.p1  ORF type:complete len:301 (+),score=73.31 gb/GECH01002063.1/:1-903(+)